jgi:hypothetical protein
VKNRQFAFLIGATLTSVLLIFSACKKINESTELGDDLIPAVDNINTFDTTISVETYNGIFEVLSDSTRSVSTDQYFLGHINNDPLFGVTDASIYLELKPTFYKFGFKNIGHADSLFLDSAVLVLDYIDTYGDTTVPQTIDVREITSQFKFDSNYYVNRNSFSVGASLLQSPKTFLPSSLNDSVKAYLDTTRSQLRIKLDHAFGEKLLLADSTGTPAPFASDSAFRDFFKGFAIIPANTNGNAIMAFNLGGANTKLAFYYRYQKGGTGIANQDTTVDYFRFTTVSASANKIERTHSPAVVAASTSPAEDPLVYIQATPGTFANIKIPALATLSNRVVHRAELIMEQVYDPSDTIFPPPPALFLDAWDAADSKFRTIPYDLAPDGQGGFNFGSFGTFPRNQLDPNSGKNIRVWKFNVSRYVQHVLTQTVPYFDLRVFAPYYTAAWYRAYPTTAELNQNIFVNTSIARGRVRLGGGNHPTQKMRLRIVYSKI